MKISVKTGDVLVKSEELQPEYNPRGITVRIYFLLKKLNSYISLSLGTICCEHDAEGRVRSLRNKTYKFTEFGIY